jgi:transposase
MPRALQAYRRSEGDAPQAAALIEGLPAEVVMADTAYDADHLRQAIAAKGAIAVVPNNPSRALNIRSTSISMPSAISSNAASRNSSSSAASQLASKRPREITAPSSLSLPSSYGCDKCPHDLVQRAPMRWSDVGLFIEVLQLGFEMFVDQEERL